MPVLLNFDSADPVLLKFLHSFPPFKNLPEDDVKSLALTFKKYKYNAGELIFNQNETGDDAYFIESGKLSFEILGRSVKYYQRGDMFGELALLDTRVRQCIMKRLICSRICLILSNTI